MIELTASAIDVSRIIAAASNPAAGGLTVFIGTIRNANQAKDKAVIRLEYEAYEPMAISEIQKIIDDAVARWDLRGWAVSHRTGIVNPGEAAVVIAVSTVHRKESFEACQYIIDTLKSKAPIWKKEIYEDGGEWISARP